MKNHYETILIWKDNHSPLSPNKYGNIGNFKNSVKNLRRTNKLEEDDKIMHEKKATEIIEKVEVEEVNETVTETVFLPHRPV